MNKTIIIAEAGVNHNGSLEFAKQLIDVAAAAGADFVKFQTFKTDKTISKNAKKADYQKINFYDNDDSQYSMLKKLEMSDEMHYILKEYCVKKNINFLSTAFDIESVDLLDKLGISFFKIPSGEITNRPLIEHIAKKGKDIVLSTGMSYLEEINDAIEVLENTGLDRNRITVLHCNTEYPTPMEDVNLMAMLQIRDKFGVKVGYSDHTLGIEVPIAAVALGAVIIEKHFTLNRNMQGPDHKASLEPKELSDMVLAIRNIEKAISGSGNKIPSASERKNINIARKSLFYNGNFNKGHVLTMHDLIAKRPGGGVSPMKIYDVIGKKLIKDVVNEQIVKLEDVE